MINIQGMNIMDLNSLYAKNEATIVLKDRNGEVIYDESTPPKPMSFTVMGPHTKEYKAIARKIGFLVHKRNKKNDIENMSADDFNSLIELNEADELELQAATVTACNLFIDGKSVKCTPDNIIKVLSDERLDWIKAQFVEEVTAGEVFFAA